MSFLGRWMYKYIRSGCWEGGTLKWQARGEHPALALRNPEL